jgi:hypothetical protein
MSPFPSPEDGNRSSFGNVFSGYLDLRTTDRVHKSHDSEWYTPSSTPLDSARGVLFNKFCGLHGPEETAEVVSQDICPYDWIQKSSVSKTAWIFHAAIYRSDYCFFFKTNEKKLRIVLDGELSHFLPYIISLFQYVFHRISISCRSYWICCSVSMHDYGIQFESSL